MVAVNEDIFSLPNLLFRLLLFFFVRAITCVKGECMKKLLQQGKVTFLCDENLSHLDISIKLLYLILFSASFPLS